MEWTPTTCLQIFTLGCVFIEVYNKEGFGWLDFLSSVVFLPFDPTVTSGKFSTH